MKKKLIKGFLYLLGILILGFIIVNSDWREVLNQIKSIPPPIIILLLLLQCLTVLLLNIQWTSMALWVSKTVSFFDMLIVNAVGNIVATITPGVKVGGEFVRIYELRNRLKMDFLNATIVVGLQKTLSMFSFLFLTLCSLIWFSFSMGMHYKNYIYLFSTVIAIFSILLAVLIIFSFKPDSIIKLLNKIFSNSKIILKIEKALRDYSRILEKLSKDKRKFFNQILLALLIWLLYAFKMFIVMKTFNVEMDYISMAAITFLTYIMGMIPLLPGSIGSFESSMVALLSLKGIPMEVGISVALVFRFVTFWFEFLLSCGIFVLNKFFVFNRKGNKNVGVRL